MVIPTERIFCATRNLIYVDRKRNADEIPHKSVRNDRVERFIQIYQAERYAFGFIRFYLCLRCKSMKPLHGLQALVGEKHAFRNPNSRLWQKKPLTLTKTHRFNFPAPAIKLSKFCSATRDQSTCSSRNIFHAS
jgi:hypothetical protein